MLSMRRLPLARGGIPPAIVMSNYRGSVPPPTHDLIVDRHGNSVNDAGESLHLMAGAPGDPPHSREQQVAVSINGNILRYWALNGAGIRTQSRQGHKLQLHKTIGRVLVCFLQFYAPLVLLSETGRLIHWDLSAPVLVWGDPQTRARRLLSLLFLIAFVLNGLLVVVETIETNRRCWDLIRACCHESVLTQGSNQFGLPFLLFDIVTSMYIWIVCSVCMCYFLIDAPDSTAVLYDSFGLLFLYNLDDIGGDFVFLDNEDWDEGRMSELCKLGAEGPQGLWIACSQIAHVAFWIMIVCLPFLYTSQQGIQTTSTLESLGDRVAALSGALHPAGLQAGALLAGTLGAVPPKAMP